MGGGEAIHRKQRWEKMPAQHIEMSHLGQGDGTEPPAVHLLQLLPPLRDVHGATAARPSIYAPSLCQRLSILHLQTHVYVCSSHKKGCILIGPLGPIKGSTPPLPMPRLCFPPLALRSRGDPGRSDQLSLQRTMLLPSSSSSSSRCLTFLDIQTPG